jgi:undecaprenyl-diphosphatase
MPACGFNGGWETPLPSSSASKRRRPPTLSDLDRRLLLLLRSRLRTPALDRAAAAYAFTGESGALWIGLALTGALADPPRRARWLAAAGTVPLTLAVNYVVKRAVARERPQIEGLEPFGRVPRSRSFPSAHAATAFAGAYRIGALVPRRRRLLLGAAALMAFTRPYLGVHYPSDVVAGAAVGLLLGRTLEAVS